MLEIKFGKTEVYDEVQQKFSVSYNGPTFCLEHSLLSISMWEAKYKKPFLSGKDDKTQEEILDYFGMMVTSGDKEFFMNNLTEEHVLAISDYIGKDRQTATWFSEEGNQKARSEVMTSEVIYYMVFVNRIDKACEEWNINRLLTLIRVFSEKNKEMDPNRKKMPTNKLMARNRALNEARRKQLRTKG